MKHDLNLFILIGVILNSLIHFITCLSFEMRSISQAIASKEGTIKANHHLRQLNSTNFQTFDDIYHIMTIEVCIGRPSQCFNLLYDTGMMYMIVADINAGAEFNKAFNISISQSVRNENTNLVALPYRTGTLKARELIDYVSIGSTMPSFGFNFLMSFHTSERFYFDGILGLGRFYPEKNEGNQFDKRFSFIDYLHFNKLIKHKMFAHEYFNRTYGKFYVDEIPKSLGKDYFRCKNEPFISFLYKWHCEMRSVSFSTGENFTEIASPVVFDTGFVNVRGPINEGTIIFLNFLQLSDNQCEIEEKGSYQKLKCPEGFKVTKFPHIHFNLKGMQLTFFNEDMFRLVERDGKRFLISKLILDARYQYWEIGEPVLKNYNMLFDYENDIVGIVPNVNFERESWVSVIILSLILTALIVFGVWFYINRKKLLAKKLNSENITMGAAFSSGEVLSEVRKK